MHLIVSKYYKPHLVKNTLNHLIVLQHVSVVYPTIIREFASFYYSYKCVAYLWWL